MSFSPEKQYLQYKEVSSEQKERAIKYAQELKSLRAKESPTEEDKKRAEELAKRIKWIYSPEKRLESEKARELLQDLKHTALYDEKEKQWNEMMNKEGKLVNSMHYSDAQLLGVLAEAVTGNLKGAKKLLQGLKDNTVLYDKEKKQWNEYMTSYDQLLGVLAEAVTGNLEGAKELLQDLKDNTVLYDKKKKQWNEWINEKGEIGNSYRYSEPQLLGVLAEAVTGNLEGAKKLLQNLKNTALYDKKKKQWNGRMNEEGKLENSDRYSEDQLLGVLAEAVTGNLKGAKKLLQGLKDNTVLYDKKKKQWDWKMDKKGKLVDSDRPSDTQLLGVLAEALSDKGEELVWFLTH